MVDAQDPKRPAIEPEAKARLHALIAANRALPAYADHGEVTLVVKVGARELKQVQKASIAFARPNKVDVRTELVRLVSDGSTMTSSVSPLKKYFVSPAPRKFAESSLRGGPLGSIEFGGVAGLPLVHVLSLVIGDEPERLIYDFTPKVLAEAVQVIDGVSYKVLRIDESDNHDWRFLIDPKTGLLGYIDLVVEGDATKSSIAGGDTHVESLRWAAGAISTQVPGAEAFAFKPEAGFAKVGSTEKPAEAKAEVAEAQPLVGKPAPEVLDRRPRRSRQVPARWRRPTCFGKQSCSSTSGPPGAAQPGRASRYPEAHPRRVWQGQERGGRGDGAEHRRGRSRRPERGPGEGWRTSLSGDETHPGRRRAQPGRLGRARPLEKGRRGSYGVQAIPFVVLIDPKGIVRAVHVGVTAREVLAGEVAALLAGKPIGEGK